MLLLHASAFVAFLVIAAIAAGNTCMIKPSELPENTMKAMAKLINENFDPQFLYVVEGGVEETTAIFDIKHKSNSA